MITRRVKIDLAPVIESMGSGGRLYWHAAFGVFMFEAQARFVEVVPPPLQHGETKVRIEGSYWTFSTPSKPTNQNLPCQKNQQLPATSCP